MIKTPLITAVAVLATIAPAMAWVDTRYAKAEDFDTFIGQYQEDTADRYEEKVEEMAESIRILEGVHPRGETEQRRLLQLKDRRSKYLRKLERYNK